MLQRVLEPEVMDSPEEARDYNNMDHSQVNRVFVEDLFAAGFVGGDVLDLGTGTALIPIELVARCRERNANSLFAPVVDAASDDTDDDKRLRIMAADAAIHMLERARLNVEVAGMREAIQLSHCDAKAMPYTTEMFDWVISNSIIHHIPEPLDVLREAWRVTRQGGYLFFRDLMRPESEHQCQRFVDLYAADANEHQRQMFGDSLRAALSLVEIRSLVAELGCSPDTVMATSDRHWTWIATK